MKKSVKEDKSAIKELNINMKDVRKARSSLQKETGKLKNNIGKDITGALKQDAIVKKRVKKAIKK